MAMLCEANCNELSLEEELLEFDEIERQAMEWQANMMKMHKELQRQSAATGQVLRYQLNWGPKYGLGRPILVHPDDLSTEDTQVRTSKAKRARRGAIASRAEVVVAPPDWTPLPTGCGCPSRA